MKETYDVKYRQPGQWLWRKLKNVKGDAIESGFRWFLLEDDTLISVSLNAEVVMSPHRAAIKIHQMSREAGQPIQRA